MILVCASTHSRTNVLEHIICVPKHDGQSGRERSQEPLYGGVIGLRIQKSHRGEDSFSKLCIEKYTKRSVALNARLFPVDIQFKPL